MSLECLVCGRALVRNGKTAAVKQRYRCLGCGASRSGERQDVSRRSELEAFLGWLTGTSNQSSLTSFGAARPGAGTLPRGSR
ncbi:transposase-like zinc-binding domain-containing protein [Arthrobacter bambusae]